MRESDPFLPPGVPEAYRSEVSLVLSDREKFVSLLQIKHKELKKFVQFEPNDAQRGLWSLLDEHNRVIVVKARQVGISTAVRAHQFWRAFVSHDPETYAVLSYHASSAKKLRQVCDSRWLKDLPGFLAREYEVNNAEDTVFDDTKAGFQAFTVGGKGGTRSFEFSGCHLTEFAYYDDPTGTLAQADATVGQGPLVIESTARVPGDKFHQLIAGAPENGWRVFTYWWWEHAAYRDENLPDDFEVLPSEIPLVQKYGLDLAQLWWRRKKIMTLGAPDFRREYPACMADAFTSRQSTYFSPVDLDNIQQVWFDTPEREFLPPEEGRHYVMGVDVAAGIGLDYSALVVIDLGTLQPVYIERSNELTPVEWAAHCVEVGDRYNEALMLVEANNHGWVVLRELDVLRYRNLWRKPGNGKPWVTTARSKLEAFEALREAVRTGVLFRLDQSTLQELRALEVPKLTPQAPAGMHDDLAMALALAYRCVQDAPRSKRRESSNKVIDLHIRKQRLKRLKQSPLPWGVNV
jgi:hypothetical protein